MLPRDLVKEKKKQNCVNGTLPSRVNTRDAFFGGGGGGGGENPISDHSDHGASKEPTNPCPEWIRRFL